MSGADKGASGPEGLRPVGVGELRVGHGRDTILAVIIFGEREMPRMCALKKERFNDEVHGLICSMSLEVQQAFCENFKGCEGSVTHREAFNWVWYFRGKECDYPGRSQITKDGIYWAVSTLIRTGVR